MESIHKPVFLRETIAHLKIKKGEKYIDATVGRAGHAEAILKLGGKLLALDCDPEAVKAAKERLSTACPVPHHDGAEPNASWQLAQGNFNDLAIIAKRYGFTGVAGILFDLGISSDQLGKAGRGFSFNLASPLDMRMDPAFKVTAADLVNGLSKGELDELFTKLVQEHYSRRIAEAICRARRIKPIQTTEQLAEVVSQSLPKKKKRGSSRLHPATRVFLALRMAVNNELDNLRKALPQALAILKFTGRLAVISFHSGEDRIVKQFFRKSAEKGEIKIITAKPIRPTLVEVKDNPRSRSAKLRVGEKWKKQGRPKN